MVHEISYIRSSLDETDVLLQMAEEASELSQAAAKRARILIGRNPSPVSEQESLDQLLEEYADVNVCAQVLFTNEQFRKFNDSAESKMKRWASRIKESCNNRNESPWAGVAVDGKQVKAGDVLYGVSDGVKWEVVEIAPDSLYPLKCVAVNARSMRKDLKAEWLLWERKFCKCREGSTIGQGSEVYVYDPPSVKGSVNSIVNIGGSIKAGVSFPEFHDVVYMSLDNLCVNDPDSLQRVIEDFEILKKDPETYCVNRKIAYRIRGKERKFYEEKADADIKNRLYKLYKYNVQASIKQV